MRLEPNQFWSYGEWFIDRGGLLNGFLLAIVLAAVGFFLSYVVAMVRYGPGEGFYVVSKNIRDLFRRDLPNTTPRRIGAIAKLAFKEAVRRRVLAVVAIFVIGLMFAGWYLDPRTDHPSRLYISFVLTATNYLVLLLGLYLSAFSLPADIKNKTIHTVTTKPVRATEIVLGRVLGFVGIGTAILASLGLLSYIFVVRGLSHTHVAETVPAPGRPGTTSLTADHRHTFTVAENGYGVTDVQKGHYHAVRAVQDGERTVYEVGSPQGDLLARVPVYGTLEFADRDGNRGGKQYGLNVGYISEYQKYIAGNSLMSAIWTFDGVTPERFGDSIRLEMTLSAFRTYKGDIVTPVRGILILRSPDGRVESERQRFLVKEFALDERTIPRKLSGFVDGVPKEIDLFNDLAPDGRLEVIIRCDDQGQYLGMAQADLSLRAGDRSFTYNFFKGYVSIWLQMVIVICFGVMFSTFLSGPVAMIATLAVLVLGFFGGIVSMYFERSAGYGGGPIESFIRIVTQRGVMIDLDTGNATLEQIIGYVDFGLMYAVRLLAGAVPDFGVLGTSDFIAYGVDLFDGLLLRHLTIALGYFLATMTVAYFFLKTREIAA